MKKERIVRAMTELGETELREARGGRKIRVVYFCDLFPNHPLCLPIENGVRSAHASR